MTSCQEIALSTSLAIHFRIFHVAKVSQSARSSTFRLFISPPINAPGACPARDGLVFIGQEQCCHAPVRFRNDPELQAIARTKRREEPKALPEREFVLG